MDFLQFADDPEHDIVISIDDLAPVLLREFDAELLECLAG